MVKENIRTFVDYYNKKQTDKQYVKKLFESGKENVISQLEKWSSFFESSYGYNPFDKNFQGMTFDFVEKLKSDLLNKNTIYTTYSTEDYSVVEKFISRDYIDFLVSKLYGEDEKLYHSHQAQLKKDSTIPYKDEFLSWLTDNQNLSKKSTSTHFSHLNGLNEKVFRSDQYPNLFFKAITFLIEEEAKEDLTKYLNNCMKSIEEESEEKMRAKYKIALNKYRDFLLQKIS